MTVGSVNFSAEGETTDCGVPSSEHAPASQGMPLMSNVRKLRMHLLARLIALPVTVAALSACAVTHYTPPSPAQSKARLRVAQAQKSSGLEVMHLPQACLPNLSINKGLTRISRLDGIGITIGLSASRTSLGMPAANYPSDSYTEFYIPADGPFSLGLSYKTNLAMAVRTCFMAESFQPEPGKDYEALFTAAGGLCELSVRELSVKNGDVSRSVPLPLKTITERCK